MNPDALRPDQISDPTLQAARLVVGYFDDPTRNRYRAGLAEGALRVWAAVLDMSEDTERAIELARTCVEDAEKGADQ